ncbi:mannose-specific adhesin, LPXTG-motif cell wall anchor [Secundilactobacillus pentosiphilus]|uniref:Mannose-specific adhesin, LPXTG-motif cell wall anchor n=1 Tax=Secundilactobacillus pentosiphilus TaxID=1714682 RepID=A0A1Z5IU16_9LACO|nr:KxYKxGKxW signal peptide domain-containing protein [Secundilactobacillus pentosiphilus]GAX05263.1 mannose-specific adhesin, LPXTG-motif cell wall anchor [Secundilactobacillus pentosiphilus]
MSKKVMTRQHNRVLRDCTQVKEHYKMYKVGKLWIFAGLFTVSFGAGIFFGESQDAQAEVTTAEPTASETNSGQSLTQQKSVAISGTTKTAGTTAATHDVKASPEEGSNKATTNNSQTSDQVAEPVKPSETTTGKQVSTNLATNSKGTSQTTAQTPRFKTAVDPTETQGQIVVNTTDAKGNASTDPTKTGGATQVDLTGQDVQGHFTTGGSNSILHPTNPVMPTVSNGDTYQLTNPADDNYVESGIVVANSAVDFSSNFSLKTTVSADWDPTMLHPNNPAPQLGGDGMSVSFQPVSTTEALTAKGAAGSNLGLVQNPANSTVYSDANTGTISYNVSTDAGSKAPVNGKTNEWQIYQSTSDTGTPTSEVYDTGKGVPGYARTSGSISYVFDVNYDAATKKLTTNVEDTDGNILKSFTTDINDARTKQNYILGITGSTAASKAHYVAAINDYKYTPADAKLDITSNTTVAQPNIVGTPGQTIAFYNGNDPKPTVDGNNTPVSVAYAVPEVPGYTFTTPQFITLTAGGTNSIKLNYQVATASAMVSFKNSTTGQALPATDNLTMNGNVGAAPTTGTAITIPAGYKLDTTKTLPASITKASDSSLTYTGKLTADDTDNAVIPVVIAYSAAVTKTVTESIGYEDSNGIEVAPGFKAANPITFVTVTNPVDQSTVVYYTTDKVPATLIVNNDGTITGFTKGDSASFKAVPDPTVDGYYVATTNDPANDLSQTTAQTVTPNSDNVMITVIYKVATQTMKVELIYPNGNVANTWTTTGLSNKTITYDNAAILKLVPKNYTIQFDPNKQTIEELTDGFAKDFDTDAKTTQVEKIYLADALGADSKTTTRTIHYVDGNGNTIKPDSVQDLTWTAPKDLVTNKDVDIFNPIGYYPAQTAPTISGYTYKSGMVADENPMPTDTPDNAKDVTLTYTADPQSINIQFVDNDGNKLGDPTPLTGVTNGNIDLKPAITAEQALINTGYTPAKGNNNGLVSVPKTFTDYGKTPTYTVVLNKVENAEANLTMTPVDKDGNPIPNTTPTTVSGKPGTDVDVPNVPGYTPQGSTTKINTPVPDGTTVGTDGHANPPAQRGTSTNITYTANPQSIKVQFVDENNTDLGDVTLTGVTNGKVDLKDAFTKQQAILNQGFTLKPGNSNGLANVTKTFTTIGKTPLYVVVLSHIRGVELNKVPTDNVPSAKQYTINFVTPDGSVVKKTGFAGNDGNIYNFKTDIPTGYVLTPGKTDTNITVPKGYDPKTPFVVNITTPAGQPNDGIQTWFKTALPTDTPSANTYPIDFVTPGGDVVGHTTVTGNPGNNFNVTPNIPKGYVPTPGNDQIIVTVPPKQDPKTPINVTVTTPAGQDTDGVQVWTKGEVPTGNVPSANQYTINIVTTSGTVVGTKTVVGNPGNIFDVTDKVPNGYVLVNNDGHVTIPNGQDPQKPITVLVAEPDNVGPATDVPDGGSTDEDTGEPTNQLTDEPSDNSQKTDTDNNTVTSGNHSGNNTTDDNTVSRISGASTGLTRQSSRGEAGQAQQTASINSANSNVASSNTAKSKAATLPQTNEQSASVWTMIGLSLMSMLSMLGITKKKREDEK